MKKSIMLFFFLALAGSILSQTITKESINNLKSNHLEIQAEYGNVILKTWDKPNIEIVASVSINGGEDDSKYSLEVNKSSHGIIIKSEVDTDDLTKKAIAFDKDGNRVVLDENLWKGYDDINNASYQSVNYSYDIEVAVMINVPRNMSVETDFTYGDLEIDGQFKKLNAESTYGVIEARIDGLNEMESLSLDATYDLVDLTIDKNSDATFQVSNRHGKLMTDLPLISSDNSRKKNSCGSPCNTKYSLNNGTVQVNLCAPYDNIYLRSVESSRSYELKKL